MLSHRDTLKVECLMQAIDDYADASRDEAEARSRYEGYSWDYFGRSYIAARERAAAQIADRLDEYIDARIQAILSAEEK